MHSLQYLEEEEEDDDDDIRQTEILRKRKRTRK
jgi:hypothetical protein